MAFALIVFSMCCLVLSVLKCRAFAASFFLFALLAHGLCFVEPVSAEYEYHALRRKPHFVGHLTIDARRGYVGILGIAAELAPSVAHGLVTGHFLALVTRHKFFRHWVVWVVLFIFAVELLRVRRIVLQIISEHVAKVVIIFNINKYKRDNFQLMGNILSRIQEIAANEGITINAFERSIGASKGVLSRALKSGTDIQSKWLCTIVDNYPQYSPSWLLTGVGPMLLDVAPPAQVSSVNSAVAMHGNAINTITNESAGGDSSVSQELKMAQQKIEALEKLLNEKERLIKVLLDKK